MNEFVYPVYPFRKYMKLEISTSSFKCFRTILPKKQMDEFVYPVYPVRKYMKLEISTSSFKCFRTILFGDLLTIICYAIFSHLTGKITNSKHIKSR